MSLVHLASALVYCKERSPQNKLFTTKVLKNLSKGPKQRADIPTLAAMFDYCLNPPGKTEKIRAQRQRERHNLLTYLRVSIVTMARPEAVGGRLELDLDGVDLARLEQLLTLEAVAEAQAQDSLAEVQVEALRVVVVGRAAVDEVELLAGSELSCVEFQNGIATKSSAAMPW